MTKPDKNPFETEKALCAAFLDALDKEVWQPYAETAGWDILLVRKVDGFQIGIEAKMRMNVEVITQALEDWGSYGADHAGPDCRAVLVPSGRAGFDRICAYLGITVLTVAKRTSYYTAGRKSAFTIYPDLPEKDDPWRCERWHEWSPTKRHRLPEYIPDVAAGDTAPVQLTDWKIKALKLCVILARRGYLLRSDFKHVGADHRRWLTREGGWLSFDDQGRLVAGERMPPFKQQHPRVYAEVEADFEKWKPAGDLLATVNTL